MPVINYQGTKMSAEQKKELIEQFTSVALEITGTPEQFHTIVIREFEDNSMGTGGKTVVQIKSEILNK